MARRRGNCPSHHPPSAGPPFPLGEGLGVRAPASAAPPKSAQLQALGITPIVADLMQPEELRDAPGAIPSTASSSALATTAAARSRKSRSMSTD